jgi:hypothetical protein
LTKFAARFSFMARDKINQYQAIILELLNEHKTGYQEYVWGNNEDVVLADKESHHYQLLSTGWQQGRHINDILIHFHIKSDGKIWIQANHTEVRVAHELENKGVPKSDIVLGFHPEHLRHMTDYAVA